MTAFYGSSDLNIQFRTGFNVKADVIPQSQIDSVEFTSSAQVTYQTPPVFDVGQLVISGTLSQAFQPGLQVVPVQDGVLEFRINPQTGSDILDFFIEGLRFKVDFITPEGHVRFDILQQGYMEFRFSKQW